MNNQLNKFPEPFDRDHFIQDYLTAIKWSVEADTQEEREVFSRIAARLESIWHNWTGNDDLYETAAASQPPT